MLRAKVGQIGKHRVHTSGLDSEPLGNWLPRRLPRKCGDDAAAAGVERARVRQVVWVLTKYLSSLDRATQYEVMASPCHSVIRSRVS